MQILCGQCGRTLDVPDDQAGHSIRCRFCGHSIVVGRSSLGDEYGQAGGEDEGFVGQIRQAMNRKIRIACGSCGRGLVVPGNMAGKMAICPACKQKIRIPHPDEDLPQGRSSRPASQAEQEITEFVEDAPETSPSAGSPPKAPPDRPEVESGREPPASPARPDEAADNLDAMAGGGRAAVHPAPRRIRIRRRRSLWGVVIGLGVLCLLAGALWIVLTFLPEWTAEPPASVDQFRVTTPGPAAPPQSQPIPQPPPAVATAPVATAPARAEPAPAAAPAEVKVRGVSSHLFAAGRYFPAGPASVYWRVQALVTAGSTPLELPIPSDGIVMDIAGTRYRCLGLAGAEVTELPLRASRGVVRLPAGRSAGVTLLFELPQAAREGTLRITGMAAQRVGPVATLDPPAGPPAAGEYVETAPRSLPLMPRDKLLAAIVASGPHTLTITTSGTGFGVELPSAGATGRVASAGPGLYAGVLTVEGQETPIKIRLVEGGKTVVLYLKDEPSHQILFARKSS